VDGASETEKRESEQMTGVVFSEAVAEFGELGGRDRFREFERHIAELLLGIVISFPMVNTFSCQVKAPSMCCDE
jgi:hypothetical protein